MVPRDGRIGILARRPVEDSGATGRSEESQGREVFAEGLPQRGAEERIDSADGDGAGGGGLGEG